MGKKQYIVKFAGLPVGTHQFEFNINGTFFEQFEDSEITEADLEVVIVLTKQNNLMKMQFDINGTVNLSCDRCLTDYNFPSNQCARCIKWASPVVVSFAIVMCGALYVARRESLRERDSFRFGFGMASYFLIFINLQFI